MATAVPVDFGRGRARYPAFLCRPPGRAVAFAAASLPFLPVICSCRSGASIIDSATRKLCSKFQFESRYGLVTSTELRKMPELRHCSLFSGIGGFDVGLRQAGIETVMICENDSDARAVLKEALREYSISKRASKSWDQ